MPLASVNGAELYYEATGEGEPILLIHGNGANTRIWGKAAEHLAASHRVIAYDRRGFGRSSGPLAKGMETHVKDASALLGQLDALPATVLGWSGGGVIAMGLAADYPYDVASLVLEEAAIHLLRNATPSMVRMMAGFEVLRRLARNERGAAAQMFRWSLSYSTGGSAFDRFPADWQESMLASAPAAVREVDHLGRSYPTREQIGSIECPVTWIEGTLSEKAFHKCHRYALKLLSHGPHSVTIDGGCHALHFDRPGEFARAVRDAALAGEGVPG